MKFDTIIGGIWGANNGGYTWAIYHEPGLPDWTEAERAEYVGYTASYRRNEHTKSDQTIKIGRFPSLDEAKAACEDMWSKIRSAT